MNEIHDGSVIQLGIGGMPNAVGMMIAQSDLKDLGVHTEMLCDAFVDMYQAGRVTNKKKQSIRERWSTPLPWEPRNSMISSITIPAAPPIPWTM